MMIKNADKSTNFKQRSFVSVFCVTSFFLNASPLKWTKLFRVGHG